MSIELLITIIGGLTATFKWVFEYSKQLRWEKNKFLLEKIEEFNQFESTKVMHKLLDWNAIKINLGDEEITITDNDLLSAFQTHNVKHSFTSNEVKLRAIFDEYFDSLSKLVYMTKNGLINRKGLNMFMGYWFNILSGRSSNKNKNLRDAIYNYMKFYNFIDLKNYLDNKS